MWAASMALICAGVSSATVGQPNPLLTDCDARIRNMSGRPMLGKLASTMKTLDAPRTEPGAESGSVSRAVMGSRASGFYRHDLDGLRGIAIALVAMFHIWFGRVSGGVDVFLALSGFFFGGKILRLALDTDAPLQPFPEVVRLIRRL